MSSDFVVDAVSWHTQGRGAHVDPVKVLASFTALKGFLVDNELVIDPAEFALRNVDDDFELRSTDLTEEGMQLIRAAYDAWIRHQDRGGDPSSTTGLMRKLAKLRG